MNPLATSQRGIRILAFFLTAGLVVIVDQATKAAIRVVSPSLGHIGTLIPGVIDLVHVENTGAAFSIGVGAGFLFVIAALVVACLAFVFVRTQDVPLALTIALACVVGGGLGNMFDRIMTGSVTDFLATTFVSFPVFNVADIAVTCGVVISAILYVIWQNSLPSED